MYSWHFLLAVVAILQPISSFTERGFVNGRQECCGRQPPPLLERSKQTVDGTNSDNREISGDRILKFRDEIRDTRRHIVRQRTRLTRTSIEDLRNTRDRDTSRQFFDSVRDEPKTQRINSNDRRIIRNTERDLQNNKNVKREYTDLRRNAGERYLQNNRIVERDNTDLRVARQINTDDRRILRESRDDVITRNNARSETLTIRRKNQDDQRRSVIRAEVLGRDRRNLFERQRTRDESNVRDNRRVSTERRFTESHVQFRLENRRSNGINSERRVESFRATGDSNDENRRSISVERRVIDIRQSRETDELRLASNRRDVRRYFRNERDVDREVDPARITEYSSRQNRDATQFRITREVIRRDVDGNRRSRISSVRRQIRDEETSARLMPTRTLNREERREMRSRGVERRSADTGDRRIHSQSRPEYRDSNREVRQKLREIILVRDVSRNRMSIRNSANDITNADNEVRFHQMSKTEEAREKEIPTENNTFMNWQTALYTLQGIYLCGIFVQMIYDKGPEKPKFKNIRWWSATPKLVKIE